MNPNPEDANFLAKLIAGLGAFTAAAATWMWSHTHKRIDGKADKEAFDKLSLRIENHTISTDTFGQHVQSDERQLGNLGVEITIQRGNIAKLFDKLSEFGERTETRFTAMEQSNVQRHIDLLNAINSKK